MQIKEQISGVSVGDGDVYTYHYQPGCTLTAQQKADLEAVKIINKWAIQIPAYLELCAQLRTDNPGWSDSTVRAIAIGQIKTGV